MRQSKSREFNQNPALHAVPVKRFCIMRKLRAFSRDTKQGASLVIVICVSAFLAAFALALVYTAGMLLSRTNQRLKQERCYQLAKSFSQVLEQELTQYTTPMRTDSPPGEKAPAEEKSFYEFVCKFLEGAYGEYNPDNPEETVYHYSMGTSSAGPKYGEIQVILYKEEGQDEMAGEILFDKDKGGTPVADSSYQDPMEHLEGQQIARYVLTVEVAATLDGVTCHYSTSYDQWASYRKSAIKCTTPDGSRIITWDGTDWYTGDGVKYTGGETGIISIRYEIQEGFDNLAKCKFTKTIKEAGDSP